MAAPLPVSPSSIISVEDDDPFKELEAGWVSIQRIVVVSVQLLCIPRSFYEKPSLLATIILLAELQLPGPPPSRRCIQLQTGTVRTKCPRSASPVDTSNVLHIVRQLGRLC